MRALIYPNDRRDEGRRISKELAGWLAQNGCEAVLYETGAELDGYDFCLVLGGDGTILRAGQLLIGHGTPIVGMNLGHLGYLTEMTRDDCHEKLLRVLTGDYSCEPHLMLEANLRFADGREEQYSCINEFVLHRSNYAGAVSFSIYVNGSFMDSFKGDGILFSTPCGSTGYNLSAGGPILDPSAANIVLTPLCNHSILERSLVLPDSDEVEIEFEPDPYQEPPLFVTDGLYHSALNAPCRIEIRKSVHRFSLIRLSGQNFFQILRDKMK